MADGRSCYRTAESNKNIKTRKYLLKDNTYEALSVDEEIRKTSRANAGFERINQLFDLEREYAELNPEERYTQRQEHSKKVLDGFYAWLET